MTDSRIPAIQSYMETLFPEKENIRVENWRSIQGGWESEIFAFDLQSGRPADQERLPLALRVYSGQGAERKAAHEFTSMRQLFEAGYPVPRVYGWQGADSKGGQPFMIMDFVEGRALWDLMHPAKGAELQSWMQLFCDLFVRLHSLDWRLFVQGEQVSPDDPYYFVDTWLTEAYQSVAHAQLEDFTPIVDWLRQRRDYLGCARPAAVHLDYHPNNILIGPDGAPAVIDWTSFSVSDPRFDLAWTLTLSFGYMGEEFRDAVLHEYERQAGAPVAEIETFEVFAFARRLFDVAVSLLLGAEARGMRPEAEAAMRRDMPATMRVYQKLVERTGVRIQRLEIL